MKRFFSPKAPAARRIIGTGRRWVNCGNWLVDWAVALPRKPEDRPNQAGKPLKPGTTP
jgi:hypothetical protein